MANITHEWKRFLAVGCSHAKYVDSDAWDVVMRFRESFKPDWVCHLGDAIDMTGLMGHGSGTDSDGDDIDPDIDTGLMHLRELKPNVFLCGNHEDRAYKLLGSKNAAVAYASHKIIQNIENCCKEIGAAVIPYNGVFQAYDLADMVFSHGVLFNEMAARDTAEMLCNNGKRRKAIFAHTHKTAIMPARTINGATGYNIGTLTRRASLEYAKNRRATLAWTQGFAWGYYCEELNQSTVYLTQKNHGESWNLPL